MDIDDVADELQRLLVWVNLVSTGILGEFLRVHRLIFPGVGSARNSELRIDDITIRILLLTEKSSQVLHPGKPFMIGWVGFVCESNHHHLVRLPMLRRQITITELHIT